MTSNSQVPNNPPNVKPGTYDVRIRPHGKLEVTPDEMALTLVLTSVSFPGSVHFTIIAPIALADPAVNSIRAQAHELLLAKYAQEDALAYISEAEHEHGVEYWHTYFCHRDRQTDELISPPVFSRDALIIDIEGWIRLQLDGSQA